MSLDQKIWAQNEEVDVIILCVEATARDMIVYWLESLPVRAFVADNGYQAKRILRDVPCQLLITDRLLPPWPGLGRFWTVRTQRPCLRIAFVDNGSPGGWMLACAVGATDFLPRPLTRRSLVDVLARVEVSPEH